MELQPDAPPAPVASDSRDWSELPLDALTLVFAGLGAVEVLMGAGLVCHWWLEAAKAPELWRKVDMGRGPRDEKVMEKKTGIPWRRGINIEDMCAMAKVAVDRSDGKLEVFVGAYFVTDRILEHIGDRSPCLKGLELVSCDEVTSKGFTYLVNKCPLLEDIGVSDCTDVYGDAIVATNRACLRLRRLRLVHIAIWTKELMAVVDGCPCMEHLSVVNCHKIVVDDALQAKCATVKTLELPTCQFDHHISDECSLMPDWDDFYESGYDYDYDYDSEYEG